MFERQQLAHAVADVRSGDVAAASTAVAVLETWHPKRLHGVLVTAARRNVVLLTESGMFRPATPDGFATFLEELTVALPAGVRPSRTRLFEALTVAVHETVDDDTEYGPLNRGLLALNAAMTAVGGIGFPHIIQVVGNEYFPNPTSS